jgi:integrase/recombinase XerC
MERDRLERDRRPGTVKWFDSQIGAILGHFGGDRILEGINATDIERFRDQQAKRGQSPATISHYRRCLKRLFIVARKKGLLRGADPMDAVDGWPTVERKPMKFLQGEDIERILGEILESGVPNAERDHDVIAALFLTGLRKSELARLEVDDLDLKGGSMWIRGKTRNERMAISVETAEILGRMVVRAGREGLLVPLEEGSGGKVRDGVAIVTQACRRWAKRLDEPRLTPHALRRSFVTALINAGHGLEVVKKYSRHKTLAMVERYFEAAPDDREILASISIKPKERKDRLRKLE